MICGAILAFIVFGVVYHIIRCWMGIAARRRQRRGRDDAVLNDESRESSDRSMTERERVIPARTGAMAV